MQKKHFTFLFLMAALAVMVLPTTAMAQEGGPDIDTLTADQVEGMNDVADLVAANSGVSSDLEAQETLLSALEQRLAEALAAWMNDTSDATEAAYLAANRAVNAKQAEIRRLSRLQRAIDARIATLRHDQTMDGINELRDMVQNGGGNNPGAQPEVAEGAGGSSRPVLAREVVDEEEDNFYAALERFENFLLEIDPLDDEQTGTQTRQDFYLRVRDANNNYTYVTTRDQVVGMAREVRTILDNFRANEDAVFDPDAAQALRDALDAFEARLVQLRQENERLQDRANEAGTATAAAETLTFIDRLLRQVQTYAAWLHVGTVAAVGDQEDAQEAADEEQLRTDMAEMLRQWREDNEGRREAGIERFLREVYRLAESGEWVEIDRLRVEYTEDYPEHASWFRRTVERLRAEWDNRQSCERSGGGSSSDGHSGGCDRSGEQTPSNIVGAVRVRANGWRVVEVRYTQGHDPIDQGEMLFEYARGGQYEYKFLLARVDANGRFDTDVNGNRIEMWASELSNTLREPVTVYVVTNINADGGRGIVYPMSLNSNGRWTVSTSQLRGLEPPESTSLMPANNDDAEIRRAA